MSRTAYTALARRPGFHPPSFSLLAAEPWRALIDFCSSRVISAPAALGDGHPVIVYPGLGGGAITTLPLRRYLDAAGFEALDWRRGVNRGPEGDLDEWLGGLEASVRATAERSGRTVSLVGWSLGGVYARELAKRAPEAVRQVVTLATPFASLGHGNHAGTLYRLLNRGESHLTPAVEARLRNPPPVPSTSIYSKSDGIVAWRGCVGRSGPTTEHVEVSASHLGMVTNAAVMRMVAERLAQPEGAWRPYAASKSTARPAAPSRRAAVAAA